jgi:hypothetical protein
MPKEIDAGENPPNVARELLKAAMFRRFDNVREIKLCTQFVTSASVPTSGLIVFGRLDTKKLSGNLITVDA